VDPNGNLVNTYVYDPAGAPLQNGPLAYPYQYAGSEFDSQTGLYHVGSYYDPVLERVISGASPTGAPGVNLGGLGGSGPVSVGSSGANFGVSQAAVNGAIGVGAFAGVAVAGAGIAAGEGTSIIAALGSSSVLGPAGLIGAGVLGILDALDVFGGGSSPFIPNKAYLPAHTIQGGLMGSADIVLTQATGSQLHPCPPVPPAPPGVSIQANVRATQAHSTAWWVNQVRPYGNWDYKLKGSRYDKFGNFNFGATGAAAGFSENTLLRAAGAVKWAQYHLKGEADPFGSPLGAYPYGNEPGKQADIECGYQYFQSGCVQ
jgi:Bacterial toxin 44